MGKRYGDPYAPALRETEYGARLYNAWRKVRRYPHYEEWGYFPTFYEWAMQNGYVLGAWLRLNDDTKAYGPDNCSWYIPGSQDDDPLPPKEWVDGWNKTVNRIRKHYGMPPLEGTEYGD